MNDDKPTGVIIVRRKLTEKRIKRIKKQFLEQGKRSGWGWKWEPLQ